MAKVILCVTEGEKTEVKIIPQLQKYFMTHDKLEIISFEAEIYQFYRQIKDLNDDFLDTFAVLKIRHPQDDIFKQYTRSDIAEIYLFFDYDGHATQADDQAIIEMLSYFKNETDMGKLYISYPMIEAFKDPLPSPPSNIPKKILISSGSQYKKIVNQEQTNQHFHKIGSLQKSDWEQQLILHLKTGHFITQQLFTLPDYKTVISALNQASIFHHQKTQYIDIAKEIAILSVLPFFLVEYLGNPLLENWQSLDTTKY